MDSWAMSSRYWSRFFISALCLRREPDARMALAGLANPYAAGDEGSTAVMATTPNIGWNTWLRLHDYKTRPARPRRGDERRSELPEHVN